MTHSRAPAIRIGQGFDAHRLVAGRPLKLGGLTVPFDQGLEGHSDGDVLLHAIASALLGALALGDLGTHFPSSDPTLEGVDSRTLLERVLALVRERGFEIANLDSTLIAQAPRLAPHRVAIEENVASILGSTHGSVSVKVTSTDHLGAIGRKEGIAALVVVLLVAASAEQGCCER